VDVEASPSVAAKLGVMGVPTVVFLREGNPVYQFTLTGAVSKAKLSRMLAKHLGA
jgi:thioredoxin-like negative regulator of GroEL